MASKQSTSIPVLICAGVATLVWLLPQIGIYYSASNGRASLMEAESTRQVRVLEAQAKKDAATF
jgi:hypothetical protein